MTRRPAKVIKRQENATSKLVKNPDSIGWPWNPPDKMLELPTSVQNILKRESQVTLSHLKQLQRYSFHTSALENANLVPGFWYTISYQFKVSILKMRRRPSFPPFISPIQCTHRPWLKVPTLVPSLGTTLEDCHSPHWRNSRKENVFQVFFSLPFPPQLKVEQLIQNCKEAR